MLSSRLGHPFDKHLGKFASRIPFHPNSITVAGFILTLISCMVLSKDLFAGGVLVLLSSAFDVIDGVIARTNNKISRFGAFLDSVLDRYSDALILFAIAWNLFSQGNISGVLLSFITLVGSLLISYVKARAEGIGLSCNYGLMERPERILLLSAGLTTGLILPVLWILAVLTHYTVGQRIYHVWKGLKEES